MSVSAIAPAMTIAHANVAAGYCVEFGLGQFALARCSCAVNVLLMIFSIKPANGPSNRWCGHTGATLSPSL